MVGFRFAPTHPTLASLLPTRRSLVSDEIWVAVGFTSFYPPYVLLLSKISEGAMHIVILYGFQGNARLAKGNSPLIAKGHIGLSVDNGKTIYGFAPMKPNELSDNKFIFLLKRKRQVFDGQLIDDTVLFNQVAAGKFNKGSRELEL